MGADDDIANSVIDDNIEYAFSTNTKNIAVMVREGMQATKAFNEKYDGFDVQVQDTENVGFNLYLCQDLGTTTLTTAVAIDATSVVVTSATGTVVGDCINIREGSHVFQSIIKTIVGTTITFLSQLDYAFTTAATVCFGEWNMNVNGSVTPVIFKICPPSGARYHITAISFTMTDDGAMDDSKFGSLAKLANGIVSRRTDGSIANFFLISNNAGFYQNGYDTDYPTKVPSGVYSFRARKDLRMTNGTIIALDGASDDELQIIVRDN